MYVNPFRCGQSAGLCLFVFLAFSGPLLPLNMSEEQYSDKLQQWTRRIMDAIQEVGAAEAWPDFSGNAPTSSGGCLRDLPKPDTRQSDVPLGFSRARWISRRFRI